MTRLLLHKHIVIISVLDTITMCHSYLIVFSQTQGQNNSPIGNLKAPSFLFLRQSNNGTYTVFNMARLLLCRRHGNAI